MAEDLREASSTYAAPDVEELFGALFLHATDCILLTRTDGGVLRANPAACRALGRTEEQIRAEGRTGLVVTNGEARRMLAERARSGVTTGELTFRRLDGSTFVAAVTSTLIRRGRSDAHAYVIFRDLTARLDAERLATERMRFLNAVLDTSLDGLVVVDGEARLVDVNSAYCEMIGHSREELLRMRISDLEAVESPEETEAHLRRVREEGFDCFETRHRRKDGRIIVVLAKVRFIRLGEESIVCSLQDITVRKRADEALRESENRFRTLARTVPVGIIQFDVQGRPVFVNPTFLSMTGLGEAEALAVQGAMAIHPEDRERVSREWRAAVRNGTSFSSEYRHLQSTGKVSWVRAQGSAIRDASGAAEGFVGVIVDVTETRALHAQLAMASRLAAMGTLVAGVAHEINNPLAADLAGQGVALETAREARKRLAEQEPLDRDAEIRSLDAMIEALEDAHEGGQRVAHIVKDLAAFARPDLRRTPLRLAEVAQEAMRWLPASAALDATIRVEDAGAPDVFASAGQIEQVVVNLVTNAVKATPAGRRADVIVRVGPGSPGTARLEVVDHGTGIDPSILDRIFEPFFTTRPAGDGRGVGLGLSISHSIVASHGGTLTVGSEVGKGSTFRMELPVAEA
jgi:two-component system, NtrC family, sensor kinase